MTIEICTKCGQKRKMYQFHGRGYIYICRKCRSAKLESCIKCGEKCHKTRIKTCAYICMKCRTAEPAGFTPYKLPGVATRCDICRREFMAQDGATVCKSCFGADDL